MQTLRDTVSIPQGASFNFYFDFVDSEGNAMDFAGRTGTLKLRNIFKDANNSSLIECVDCIDVEPLDSEGNNIKSRIQFNIGSEYTSQLELPDNEKDPYGESGVYSIAQVTFDNGEIPIILKVKPIKTI